MKAIRFSSLATFFLLLFPFFFSCTGIKPSGTEQDDAYYNGSDRQADLQAAARAREEERKEEADRARQEQAKTASQGTGQPDYVNPQYRASGQPAPAGSGGNTYVTNNYYRNLPYQGIGFSPYTSLGYNWMYPGYSGISWRVSSFWGPMWASSCYNSWDYGFGYSPYFSSYWNPYAYNPYAWYNPWYYRPFYRYGGYYGGSYWDNYNYQGQNYGGGGASGGGRIKTNLPLGGTATGVYGGGPFGGRSEGGRLGGREAVSGTSGADIHSGSSISNGTREQPVRSSFWRRNGNIEQGAGQNSGSSSGSSFGTSVTPSVNTGNTPSGSFWRGNQRNESSGRSWETKSGSNAPASGGFGGRSQTSPSSSGWGGGTSGGHIRTSSPSSGGGPSGGRRR